MVNFVKSGRGFRVGVLFLVATLPLCVAVEAQNQRSRGPARRSSAPSTASKTTPKPASRPNGRTVAPSSKPATGSTVGGMKTKPSAGAPSSKPTGPGVGTKTRPSSAEASEEPAEKTEETTETTETTEETTEKTSPERKKDAETNGAANGKAAEGEKLKSEEDDGEPENAEEKIAELKSNAADSDAEENDGKYSSEPLDPTATKLPENYFGHNIEAVYWIVEEIFDAKKLLKDEYEKTSDYIGRVATFKSELPKRKLYGNLTFDSTLALALTQDGESSVSVSCRYDADLERFTLSFDSRVDFELWKYGQRSFYGVRFSRELLSSETYVGRNRFGVEKEVEKERFWSCGIAYSDSSDMGIDESELYLQDVAPEKARTMGDSLAALCVFKLGYLEKVVNGALTPYTVVEGWTSLDPTMDFPYDMFESKRAFCTTLPEFWIYNVETGEVYAKYSLKDLKTGKVKKVGDFEVEGTEKNDEKDGESETDETAEEKAAREAAKEVAKGRRRGVVGYQDGNRRLTNRLHDVKEMKSSRGTAASTTVAVPKDCATLKEALAEAEKKAGKDDIPRVVLDAGEYDASGLALNTFVDIQSASGNAEDVILNVDAASPITVDGETVAAFDGVTLRQIGSAKSGACVDVKRGVALFFNCVLDGATGSKSATGVKASGLKSAVALEKCRATGFSLTAAHVEDGAFCWATETVFGPGNRFGASAKGGRLEAEKCEFRGNETALYFGRLSTGGAQGNQYAENKVDAQIVDGAKVEVDAPNVEEK